MPDLNIEPGKFYRTRDKKKAIIYYVVEDVNRMHLEDSYKYHGAIWDDQYCFLQGWFDNGKHLPNEDGESDLISPWTDPPVVDWDKFPKHIVAVAMDGDGRQRAWTIVPVRRDENGIWIRPEGASPYHGGIDLYENHYIQFTGDWRNSLAIRPGYENQ